MMMSSGSWRRQRTISTRCRSPTERSATTESGLSGRPYSAETLVILVFSAAKPRAAGKRQRDVLGDGQRIEEREVLEDHADAEAARRGRIGDRHRRPLPADFARGRLQRAVEDLHQRRLAGAVLAEEGVDLPLHDREVDIVVGAERAEFLGDADRLEGWSPALAREDCVGSGGSGVHSLSAYPAMRAGGKPRLRTPAVPRSAALRRGQGAARRLPQQSRRAPSNRCPRRRSGRPARRFAPGETPSLGKPPLEADALAVRADQSDIGKALVGERRMDDREIELVAVGHHQDERARRCRGEHGRRGPTRGSPKRWPAGSRGARRAARRRESPRMEGVRAPSPVRGRHGRRRTGRGRADRRRTPRRERRGAS